MQGENGAAWEELDKVSTRGIPRQNQDDYKKRDESWSGRFRELNWDRMGGNVSPSLRQGRNIHLLLRESKDEHVLYF